MMYVWICIIVVFIKMSVYCFVVASPPPSCGMYRVCVCVSAIITYLNCNLNVKPATWINLNICLPLEMRLASYGCKMICLLQLSLSLLLLLQLLQLLLLLQLMLLLLSLCSQSSHCGLIIINIPPIFEREREITIMCISHGNLLFAFFSIFNHNLHASIYYYYLIFVARDL